MNDYEAKQWSSGKVCDLGFNVPSSDLPRSPEQRRANAGTDS